MEEKAPNIIENMTELERLELKYKAAPKYMSRLTVWQVESWRDSYKMLILNKTLPENSEEVFRQVLKDLRQATLICDISGTDGYFDYGMFHHQFSSKDSLQERINDYRKRYEFPE